MSNAEADGTTDYGALRANLLVLGEALAKSNANSSARIIAEAMAELELARESRLCLLDFLIECNPRKGEYAIPPVDLIEWGYRIIRRGYRKESKP
jgi:hypothetical protein